MATISRCGIRMDRFHGGLISRVEGFNSPSRYLGSYSKLTYYEAPDIAFRRFDSCAKRHGAKKSAYYGKIAQWIEHYATDVGFVQVRLLFFLFVTYSNLYPIKNNNKYKEFCDEV